MDRDFVPPGIASAEGAHAASERARATSIPPVPMNRGLRLVGLGLLAFGLCALVLAGGVVAWTMFGDSLDNPFDDEPRLAEVLPDEESPPSPQETAVAAPPVEGEEEEPREPGAPTSIPGIETGTLFIESDPPGATVRINDRPPMGETPIEVGMIVPGTYMIHLTLEHHDAWSSEAVVIADDRVVVTADLRREDEDEPVVAVRTPHRPRTPRTPRVPRTAGNDTVSGGPTAGAGRLSLNTRPWSKVYIGRRLIGTTPLGGVSVPAGTVRLRLVDRDGNTHDRTIRVPAGGHVSESYTFGER